MVHMLTHTVKSSIEKSIGSKITHLQPVGGGCINDCYKINTDTAAFFCKLNSTQKFPGLFKSEARGLEYLRKTAAIRVPVVVNIAKVDDIQILLLEWITETAKTEKFWSVFGEQLAALHRCSSHQFGLEENNYMGSVVQINTFHHSWAAFFIANRLQPLVQSCMEKKLLTGRDEEAFQLLYEKLPGYFDNEPPALVHGDLWSGNFLCSNEAPVVLDPAVYYGHRSVDLGMTTLFGGFRQPFYESYHHHYPLPSNHEQQWSICNLYPLLIHLLLFGSSYAPQIRATLQQFS